MLYPGSTKSDKKNSSLSEEFFLFFSYGILCRSYFSVPCSVVFMAKSLYNIPHSAYVTIGRYERGYKMQYTYSVRCDIRNIRGKERKVYGIDASYEGEVLRSSVNLFDRKEDAENFARICNKLDLDVIHFDDVILDLLKDRELSAVMD